MGHTTALDGNRKGLRGYSTVLRPSTSIDQKANLVSLDARPEDRATWAAITVAATPNGPLGAADVGAVVSAQLVYDVDGAGNVIDFEIPRLVTVSVPAGFLRLRVGLYAPDTDAQSWIVSAQVSVVPAGRTETRPRLSSTLEVDKNDVLTVDVARGCTDAELIVTDNAVQAALNVEALFEGIQPDATVITQRAALYGAPCTLPMVGTVTRWRATSLIGGRLTIVQYLGP